MHTTPHRREPRPRPLTPRVLQLRGLFDLPEEKTSRLQWQASTLRDRGSPLVGRLDHRGRPAGVADRPSPAISGPLKAAWASVLADRGVEVLERFSLPDLSESRRVSGPACPRSASRPRPPGCGHSTFCPPRPASSAATLARLLAEGWLTRPTLLWSSTSSPRWWTARWRRSAAPPGSDRAHSANSVSWPSPATRTFLDWLQPDWVYRPAVGTLRLEVSSTSSADCP